MRALWAGILCRTDMIQADITDAQHFAVICSHFGRTVNNGRAHLHDACIHEGFHYNLIADAVYIAMRNSYFNRI